MTGPAISIVIHTRTGGRPLLRTADSVRRQGDGQLEVAIAAGESDGPLPLVGSSATRLAAAVHRHARWTAAVNLAVDRTSGEFVAIVPAGYLWLPRALDRTLAAARAESADAIAPAILVRTADALDSSLWLPASLDAASALADPRGTPPVLVARRSLWDRLGGLDESLTTLAEYEWWLRLFLAGHHATPSAEPLLAREVAGDETATRPAAPHLGEYRCVLEKHRAGIERDLHGVIAAREIQFGTLRRRHADLVVERDAGVAELDRLRAAVADRRAYLEHHRQLAVDWGDLRRIDPISREWGYDRGVPVDRRHIEDFLAAHSSDIRGEVLEVQEDDYTRRFGGPRVTTSRVLDLDSGGGRATVVADLREAPELESNRFDCVILTQTLHVIDDMDAAVGECHRVLKPGGVLLATIPSASRVCLEYGDAGDFWRATPAGARALAERTFADVSVSPHGNALTSAAFLQGLACHELTDAELDACDPYFPALTGVRARKAASDRPRRGLVLLYHRVDDRRDAHDLGVPPALFRAHLEWLTSACEIVPLEDLLAADSAALPDRAIALTFDDGYEDNLTQAAPLLQRCGAAATFFLTTRWLYEPGEYWWDALERILLGPAAVPPRLDVAGESLPTGSAAERQAAHGVLHAAMVHAPLERRERTIEALERWSGGGVPLARPMNAEAVRALAALPRAAIGAHTVNHLALPDQPDAVRVEELTACARDLSALIGRPVDTAAYPYGALDRATAALARQACRWALSCEPSPVPGSFDAARVPRLDVKPWSVEELAANVERAFVPETARRMFSLPR